MNFSDWSTAQQERLENVLLRARTSSLPSLGKIGIHGWGEMRNNWMG